MRARQRTLRFARPRRKVRISKRLRSATRVSPWRNVARLRAKRPGFDDSVRDERSSHALISIAA
ncbi:hypothetical protein FFM54_31180 [Burkholderia pseudomallei]|nr:hypothetical protein EXY28_25420 [Burkholderia pseudomallei]QBI49719.1 hypothetical protein EXY72_25475 [Burkholderia pseudomallei]QBP51452.1 hypothetical protein E2R28_25165 [Burkholderia pseudomallei]QBP71372.1 hypothetical protein E2R25_25230 [Burkholderia pseudomallei]QBR26894.1 hypothetical protein E3O37_25505 [Burkholderia pseudomallei]